MRRLALFAACATLSLSAAADDFEIVNADQAAFKSVAKDLTAALNYKALGPAESTGLTGFGIGAFGSYVSTDADAWKALTGDDPGHVAMTGISAHKGLPFDIDVGAFYAVVPDTDAKVFGAELRYAIIGGNVALPALAIRGGYTKVSGVDDIDFDSYSVDVSVSKGFAILTPYAGVGYVWGRADSSYSEEFTNIEGDAVSTRFLNKENIEKARLFAGLRLSLLLLEITPEYERVGDVSAYNLRLGFSF